MTSAAQIEANQANAELSTGPRTPEGKAASSINATKYGFYAKHAVILNEQEHHQFELLRKAYVQLFNPTTIVELTLLDQLVLAAWNMERCNRLEAELANAEGLDPLLSETNAKTFDRIASFRVRSERSYHKCYKEISTLVALRPNSSQNKQFSIVRNEPNFKPTPDAKKYAGPKVGRNEPCPCQSGRKYKYCCL